MGVLGFRFRLYVYIYIYIYIYTFYDCFRYVSYFFSIFEFFSLSSLNKMFRVGTKT